MDRIVLLTGFQWLANTVFENGNDCAFDIKHNKAFIFSGNQCAKIKYAPHSTDSRLLSGPIPIAAMFPCLEGTMFENGVDAAINFLEKHVHIFKGDETALLNHVTKDFYETSKFALNHLSCLFGTAFESGIDAASTSHIEHEAYIFKGDYYAHINIAGFGPRSDYIVGGRINRTSDDWPALHGMLQYYI